MSQTAGTSTWRPKSISQESTKVFVGASLLQSPGTPCTLESRHVYVLETVRVPVVVWVPHTHTHHPQTHTHTRKHTHTHYPRKHACSFKPFQALSHLAILESIKSRSVAEEIEAHTDIASNVNTADEDIDGWPKPKN